MHPPCASFCLISYQNMSAINIQFICIFQNIKTELAKMKGLARDMPRQLSQYVQRARNVVQHHSAEFQSRSSNITGGSIF